ncbi:MAG: hypothetical protein ACYC8T_27775 [Myxococcaceae bacterium]
MTKKLTGLMAAVSLVFGGAALAQGTSPTDQSSPYNQPSSPETGQSQRQQESEQAKKEMQHELTGQVVKVERDFVYIEQQGAVVPLKLDKDTQFKNLSKTELKEGQEIRASFQVEGRTTNVAQEISSLPGDTGMEQQQPSYPGGQ